MDYPTLPTIKDTCRLLPTPHRIIIIYWLVSSIIQPIHRNMKKIYYVVWRIVLLVGCVLVRGVSLVYLPCAGLTWNIPGTATISILLHFLNVVFCLLMLLKVFSLWFKFGIVYLLLYYSVWEIWQPFSFFFWTVSKNEGRP